MNSTFLLTGESLLFKAYCVNVNDKRPSQLSDIAYVELIDEKGVSVLSSKVLLKSGEGDGDFFLTSTLVSGNYSLIAYTRWMKNFNSSGYYREQITVINPFRKPVSEKREIKSKATEESRTSASNQKLEIKINNETLNVREKATMTLMLKDEMEASVSVSIHKLEKIEHKPVQVHDIYTIQNDQNSTTRYLPDFRGNLISGTVKRKSDNLLPKDAVLYLSIPSKDYQFYASKIDSLGRFYINTKVSPVSDLILQVGGIPSSDVEIKLDRDFISDHKEFIPSPVNIDSTWRKIIERRSVYSQIENAYYTTKHDSMVFAKVDRFYYRADKTYKLDQFTRFPTMEDVLREYVGEVYVKKKDDSFSLKAMNGKFSLPFAEDPLLLLDGIPVFDAGILMKYDPLLIDKIDIVTKKFFYGPMSWGGVVSFETYDGMARDMNLSNAFRLKYSTVQPQKIYFAPDYDNHRAKLSRIPDYRTQLYWNPDVKLINGNSSVLNFFSSDVSGDFLITIDGFSGKGEPIHCEQLIKVKGSDGE